MIVYLDMCCIKRPFDDQTQPRIALETAAVLAILQAINDGRLVAVRSLAHDVENSRNPDHRRASAVQAWLNSLNAPMLTPQTVSELTEGFTQQGFAVMDAYHLAWAEYLKAEALITTDARFRSKSKSLKGRIKVRIVDPVGFVEEMNP